MRTRGCNRVQQGLSSEASNVVNKAMVLARQRGHSQLTPLHIANTLISSSLSSSSSSASEISALFREACVRSHSHPLHCRALELCFSVALNRLPASPHSRHRLSLSNALLAALRRAQAHHRQHQQQQSVAPLKTIELEQLIVSVLDDPGVGKVMSEAGFSSSLVKTNVEQALLVSSRDLSNDSSSTSSAHQSDDLNRVSLSLSLNPESDLEKNKSQRKELLENVLEIENGKHKLNCCAECSAMFEAEALSIQKSVVSNTHSPSSSLLPSWLRDENARLSSHYPKNVSMEELSKKWNSICSSVHRKYHNTIFDPKELWSENHHHEFETSSRIFIPGHNNNNAFSLNPNSNKTMEADEYTPRSDEETIRVNNCDFLDLNL